MLLSINLKSGLPFENKIEPISNNSHPYHLGANIVTEMEPDRKINRENITRVAHSGHEVEEVVTIPVVVLQVLNNQHPTAVHKIHLKFLFSVCVPLNTATAAFSAPAKATWTVFTPQIALYLNLAS